MICLPIHTHPHTSVSLYTIPEEEAVCFVVPPLHDEKPSSNQQFTSHRPQQHDANSNINDNDTATEEGHELVNRTRMEHGIYTLKRSIHLDALASEHAKAMAKRGAVHHSVSSIQALQVKLSQRPEHHVGENVARGRSMTQIHRDMTLHYESHALRENILSSVFHQVGMGMARGKDGYLYLCQLFH